MAIDTAAPANPADGPSVLPATALPSVDGGGQPKAAPGTLTGFAPVWIFSLELIYLAVLLGTAGLYLKWKAFHDFFPDPLGPIPIGVPWFGALGAVTISLYAIFRYSGTWDDAHDYSHIARPLTGAVVGIVGYLILASVISATGASGGGVQAFSRPVSYVAAFLLGYREQSFRELIRKATDLLIYPGEADKPTTAEPKKPAPNPAPNNH